MTDSPTPTPTQNNGEPMDDADEGTGIGAIVLLVVNWSLPEDETLAKYCVLSSFPTLDEARSLLPLVKAKVTNPGLPPLLPTLLLLPAGRGGKEKRVGRRRLMTSWGLGRAARRENLERSAKLSID